MTQAENARILEDVDLEMGLAKVLVSRAALAAICGKPDAERLVRDALIQIDVARRKIRALAHNLDKGAADLTAATT